MLAERHGAARVTIAASSTSRQRRRLRNNVGVASEDRVRRFPRRTGRPDTPHVGIGGRRRIRPAFAARDDTRGPRGHDHDGIIANLDARSQRDRPDFATASSVGPIRYARRRRARGIAPSEGGMRYPSEGWKLQRRDFEHRTRRALRSVMISTRAFGGRKFRSSSSHDRNDHCRRS